MNCLKKVFYKNSFKNNILRIDFRSEGGMIFHLHRNFEYYFKKILSYLIEEHLFEYECKRSFLNDVKKIMEDDLKIKILDPKSYFTSFNYKSYIEDRLKVHRIYKRTVFRCFVIGKINFELFETFVNDRTRKIRNSYAHGFYENGSSKYEYDRKIFFNIFYLIDKIEKMIMLHKVNKNNLKQPL